MTGLVRALLAVGAVALGVAGTAQAAPVTYMFSGNAGGYGCVVCTGSDNTAFSGAFTFVVNADTSAVDTSGNPYFRLHNVSGTLTDGSFVATLTGVTIVSNASSPFDNIDFYNNTFLNGLGLTDPALNLYDLTSSIGPITAAAGNLTPTFGGGFFTTSGSESVYLTSNSSLTFAARVPEPASFAILGIGLIGLGAFRRRKAS